MRKNRSNRIFVFVQDVQDLVTWNHVKIVFVLVVFIEWIMDFLAHVYRLFVKE